MINQRFILGKLARLAIAGALGMTALTGCHHHHHGTTALPPTAVADSYATNENTALVTAAPGVLANDTDPAALPLTATVGTAPTHGTVALAADGSFTYTPTADFVGSDSFTYTASNGSSSSAPATVTITVNSVAAVSPAGQSLVGVDPVHNTIWVPLATTDANGDLQFDVVSQASVEPAAATAGGAPVAKAAVFPEALVVVKSFSLPSADTPIAVSYDTVGKRFWIEAAKASTHAITVFVVDTTSFAIKAIPAPATVTWSDSFGGIIFNPKTNSVLVAGECSLAVIDAALATPAFMDKSVLGDGVLGTCTDSLSLNFNTQQLFIADDGTNSVVDLSPLPAAAPTRKAFVNLGGTTDGNGFDSETNILAVSPEFQNLVYVLNMGSIDGATPASAPEITVPGLGETDIVGEGPGGQATMNVSTHQALIADEYGENFWLLQLPVAPVPGTQNNGALNNKGQPGTGTTADAASAYAIAGAVIPKGLVNDTQTQLGIRGDPAALGIDQVHNIGYMLADTSNNFHSWAEGATLPLFLIAVDLSAPTVGGCPVCATHWTPRMAIVRLQ